MQARNGSFRLAAQSGRIARCAPPVGEAGAGLGSRRRSHRRQGIAVGRRRQKRRDTARSARVRLARARRKFRPNPAGSIRCPRPSEVAPSGRLKFLARASFRRPSRPRVGHQGSTAPRKGSTPFGPKGPVSFETGSVFRNRFSRACPNASSNTGPRTSAGADNGPALAKGRGRIVVGGASRWFSRPLWRAGGCLAPLRERPRFPWNPGVSGFACGQLPP